MSVTSPLATLCTVLRDVQANAQANAPLLRKNEAATRAALIDPVLRALGWDTADVRMVEPERTVEGKQILDYVLKDTEGNISVIIEAKKLDESLDKLGHVGAVIGYAFSLKPQKFFITDGIHWHYFSPTHSGFHPVSTIDLAKTPSAEAALHLIQWLDAAQSGYGIILPVSPASKAALDSPVITSAPKPPTPRKAAVEQTEFVELAHLNTLSALPEQKPRKLRLPDGSVVVLKTWKDILHKIGEFVLAQNPVIALPYPDKAGKKTALLSVQRPKAGLSSSTFNYQSKPLFLYTNYSAPACIANALYLLKLAPAALQQVSPAVAF